MLPQPIKYKLNASLLAIGASYGNLEASIANMMPRDSKLKSVILLDSNYNLYELRDGEFIYAKKLFDYEPQHQFSKACALSMNGYIAIGEPRSPNCHILHIYNGVLTPIKTLVWHRNDIYNIRFSKNGSHSESAIIFRTSALSHARKSIYAKISRPNGAGKLFLLLLMRL